MLAALDPKLEYKELLDKLVCSTLSKDCMLHRCHECPGKNALLQELLRQAGEEFDGEDIICFKQWVSTDRATLVSQQMSGDDFMQSLSSIRQTRFAHYSRLPCQASKLISS